MHPFTQMPKPGPQYRLVEVFGWVDSRRRQQVARDMLANQLVVGRVGIQGPNHVVPILICIRRVVVELVASGFCEPHQIQPMSTPAFTKLIGLEQLIH